jgi:hypothetical protein
VAGFKKKMVMFLTTRRADPFEVQITLLCSLPCNGNDIPLTKLGWQVKKMYSDWNWRRGKLQLVPRLHEENRVFAEIKKQIW